MCMAKNGRQMMSHLPLKATLLLHTVHLLSQCRVEVDFAQGKFKKFPFSKVNIPYLAPNFVLVKPFSSYFFKKCILVQQRMVFSL